jgi:hypothetical protein
MVGSHSDEGADVTSIFGRIRARMLLIIEGGMWFHAVITFFRCQRSGKDAERDP